MAATDKLLKYYFVREYHLSNFCLLLSPLGIVHCTPDMFMIFTLQNSLKTLREVSAIDPSASLAALPRNLF